MAQQKMVDLTKRLINLKFLIISLILIPMFKVLLLQYKIVPHKKKERNEFYSKTTNN